MKRLWGTFGSLVTPRQDALPADLEQRLKILYGQTRCPPGGTGAVSKRVGDSERVDRSTAPAVGGGTRRRGGRPPHEI